MLIRIYDLNKISCADMAANSIIDTAFIKLEVEDIKQEIPDEENEIPVIKLEVDPTAIKKEPGTLVVKTEPGVSQKRAAPAKPTFAKKQRRPRRPYDHRNAWNYHYPDNRTRYQADSANFRSHCYSTLREIELQIPSHDLIEDSFLKIGIWDYNQFMTDGQLAELKRALILAIINHGGIGPGFYDCAEQSGWLKITCKNKRSRDWICRTVEWLKPWPGAELTVRDVGNMENTWTATFMVDCSISTNVSEVVALLEKQNDGLHVNEWRISNVTYHNDFFRIDFHLNEVLMDELRTFNYSPSLGFGNAIIQVKANKVFRGRRYP